MSKSKKQARKQAMSSRLPGQFLSLPMSVLQSRELANLPAHACKLLLDIMSQFRFGHNGDMAVSFEKVLAPRGWRSKDTLYKALKQLTASGLIVMTRQGSLGKCSLYGLGWIDIDECGGKLDVGATAMPLVKLSFPASIEKNHSPSTPNEAKPQKKPNLGTPLVLVAGAR